MAAEHWRSVRQWCVDGEQFRMGDHVYVRMREVGQETDDEVECCRVCLVPAGQEGPTQGGPSPRRGKGRGRSKSADWTMLECDGCLGGFHLRCLDPPLLTVPEGDWFCPACEAAAEAGVRIPAPQARDAAAPDASPVATPRSGQGVRGRAGRSGSRSRDCATAEAPPARRKTAKERVLDGELAVAQIERCVALSSSRGRLLHATQIP